VSIGFDDLKVIFIWKTKKRSGQSKNIEDVELQALLDGHSVRTLEKLAETLNVGKSTISYCLHAVEKIKKEDKWVPHDLSKLTIQNCLTICTLLLSRHKKKQFLSQIVTSDKKWIYYDNPKCKKSWVD